MAQGSTQPLTEMNTWNIPGGKADNLTAICEPIVLKIGSFDVSWPYGPPRPVTGIALTIFLRCFLDYLAKFYQM
jgi:hypothetical protein